MTSSARNINWDYPGDAIPSFITMVVMPFTYSIAYGIIGGIFAYIIINGFVLVLDKGTSGRIHPDYSQRENWWTAIMGRSFTPLWIRYLIAKARGQEFDWHQDEDEYKFEDEEPSQTSDERHTGSNSPTVIISDIHESPFATALGGLETINSLTSNEKS